MKFESEHPMTSVPDAIRIVLQEAARWKFLSHQRQQKIELSITDPLLYGSVLAEPVLMQEPGYPPYATSIMDGFAVQSNTIAITSGNDHNTNGSTPSTTNQWTHEIVGKMFAGGRLQPNQNASKTNLPPAIYVTTGAVIPSGYDCVVPIEECIVSDDELHLIIKQPPQQAWIRHVGSDLAPNTTLLSVGRRLDGVSLGLIRQSGCSSVKVQPRIRVGILSTGNEVLSDSCLSNNWISKSSSSVLHQQQNQQTQGVSQRQETGLIPDVNRPVLLSLVDEFHCQPVDLGIIRDDGSQQIADRLLQEDAKSCHVIVTTGGISMGESDLVEDALVKHLQAKIHFGRLHMKPGKPTSFFTLPDDRLLFAMPGNPVSAFVCTQLLLKPCLDVMLEEAVTNQSNNEQQAMKNILEHARVHMELQATLTQDIMLDDERPEYHRVKLTLEQGFSCLATSTGVQRSSRLISVLDADGLVLLPQGTPWKKKALKGESYLVLLLKDNCIGIMKPLVSESQHLNATLPKTLNVGIIRLIPLSDSMMVSVGNDEISQIVSNALRGSKSEPVKVSFTKIFSDDDCDAVVAFAAEQNVDIIVVTVPSLPGSYSRSLVFANKLRDKESMRLADTMALQARQGAAAQDPRAGLFEVVIGYADSMMVLFLTEVGLHGGLTSVRRLLKHAVDTAKGVNMNHR